MARNVAIWVCDICGKPVRDGEGGVVCDHVDAQKVLAAQEQWEEERGLSGSGRETLKVINATEYDTYPTVEHWRVAHFGCLRTSLNDYCIDVERIRSPEQVVAWTAHLMTKTWLPGTNWHAKLQGLANQWRVTTA